MLKFTRKFQENKKKELEKRIKTAKEELQRCEVKIANVSRVLKNLAEKIKPHDMKDISKNKDCITFLSIMVGCTTEIKQIECEMEKIKHEINFYEAELSTLTQSLNSSAYKYSGDGNTMTLPLPRVANGNSFPDEGSNTANDLMQELKSKLAKRMAKSNEEAAPNILLQQSSEQENRNEMQELDAKGENLDGSTMRSSYLSVILEEEEDITVARRLSEPGQERRLNLRKSIVSLKSVLELEEFEKIEAMVAQAEAEAEAENLPTKLQQFFKPVDSNMETNVNDGFESPKLRK